MSNFRDRRASSNQKAIEANAEERDREARRAMPNRRLAPGARTISDWEAKADAPMSRKDYLNVRASEEFSRREQSWLRRAWRWLTNRPPVVDMNATLANAHARSLGEIIVRKVAEKQAEEDAATRAHPTAPKPPEAGNG